MHSDRALRFTLPRVIVFMLLAYCLCPEAGAQGVTQTTITSPASNATVNVPPSSDLDVIFMVPVNYYATSVKLIYADANGDPVVIFQSTLAPTAIPNQWKATIGVPPTSTGNITIQAFGYKPPDSGDPVARYSVGSSTGVTITRNP